VKNADYPEFGMIGTLASRSRRRNAAIRHFWITSRAAPSFIDQRLDFNRGIEDGIRTEFSFSFKAYLAKWPNYALNNKTTTTPSPQMRIGMMM
jgi:hypothetical protein